MENNSHTANTATTTTNNNNNAQDNATVTFNQNNFNNNKMFSLLWSSVSNDNTSFFETLLYMT